MSKRSLIVVVVAAAFLASGFVGVTNSEGFWHQMRKTPINWKVSGTIVTVQLAIPTMTGIDNVPGVLIDAFVRGAPGRAQFRVLAATGGPPVVIPECLGDGVNPDGQYFAFDDMVITFEDMSMLFARMNPDMDSWQCFTGAPAVANMEIIGGTGKYEGAEGNFQGIFGGTYVGDSGALIAETGTIKGWIER